jgi:hypothetical protein
VQIWFAEGSKRCRSYLIVNRRTVANKASRTEGGWWAGSLAEVVQAGDLDLRDRADAEALRQALEGEDLEALRAPLSTIPGIG